MSGKGAAARAHATPSLAAGIAALGLALPADAEERLERYLALLEKWNRTYNLTSIRDRAQMVTHHLLDALAILPRLPQRAGLAVLDVGTGGGVPGIPLAIARPDWSFTLLDSNTKKVAFLTQAAIELGLANVAPVAARVEEWSAPRRFDAIVSRAFSDLATFVALAARHLAPDGRLYAMKGVHPDDELREVPAGFAIAEDVALAVPGLDANRHLIVLAPQGAAA